MTRSRIAGIFTPNLVPLDASGEINEPRLRRYVNWLIERGVHGLYPNGSTGEFTRYTPEERRRIIAIIADEVAGRVPILAGAAEANVRETIAACEYYHSLGVRAVAIVAPFYFKLGPESVYAYFRDIAKATPIDITLYNIPMFASPIDLTTVRRLSDEFERVVAIKDSSGDLSHMMRMIAAVKPNRPDFSFLTGWEPLLVPMLLAGCDGGTHATSGILPELTRKMFDLCADRQYDEAMKLQYKLQRLIDPMLEGVDFPDGFRAGLAARGWNAGRGRQPKTSQQSETIAALEAKMAKLWAAEGYEQVSGESS